MTTHNTDEAQIRDNIHAWGRAAGDKDVPAVMKLYADDVHAFDVPPPLQFAGKAAYKAHWEKCMEMCTGEASCEIGELHVSVSGDTGVSFGLFNMSGTGENGEKQGCWLRITQVWRKEGGTWLIRHEHCSIPVDMTTGAAAFDAQP